MLRERPPKGFADLLPWGALVAPGVVVGKDGSFLAAWSYRGPDVDAATDQELAALATHLNQALRPLGGDWVLHADALRAPAPDYPALGAFPDPVTRRIDQERRQQYSAAGHSFETRYTLAVAWMPPPERASRALRWFVTGQEQRAFDWSEPLRLFQLRLEDLEDRLAARLQARRLSSEQLLAHLHTCATGLDHPIRLDGPPCYLDVLLADQDLIGGFSPKVGQLHIAPIAITGFPAHTLPGMLAFLDRLALPFRFSTRWMPLEGEAARKQLKRFRRLWWQKRRGLIALLGDALRGGQPAKEFPDQDAVRMAEDADLALAEAAGGELRFGFYTPTLLLFAERRRELQEGVRLVLKELRHRGFGARLEEVNALEAFLGSLPGVGWANVRRPILSSRNLVDLLPATSVWAGEPICPSPLFPQDSPALLWAATGGATPFRWNLHVGDVGHTLVVGPTGAGKSTLLGLLAAQWFRYDEAQVFVFDKGYSAEPLARAAGGDHYDLAGERLEELCFYPLANIHQPRERAWAAEWLEVLFDLQGLRITPAHRGAIHQALELLATSPSRTLTDLQVRLQHPELREALAPYTLRGPLGALLDAREDGLATGHFQVFEMGHLMELTEKVVVPVLLYLFHRLEQRMDNSQGGRPTLLLIDEAWTFLMHGLFAQRIQTWLKELRKKNAAVVFATQSLADLERSEKRFVLYESCPTKVFLPNPEAATEHVAPLYRDLGLNPREIAGLAAALPKREYYVTSPWGRRLVDLELGPIALAFVGAGDPESLRRTRQLAQQYSAPWPEAWLRERGIDRELFADTPQTNRKESTA